ncbi:hypothetical protein ACTVOX_25525 [Serratia marcescens]|uniref:hypothetical protein n=1 Tax=Serratia marcescens TaxID=615 RepID=UPI003FA74420
MSDTDNNELLPNTSPATQVTPSVSPVSLQEIPAFVSAAQEIHKTATEIGAKFIVYDNGTVYKDNGSSNVVAGNGVLVETTELTTTVTFVNPGIPLPQTTKEISQNQTQVITAAFTNSSQPSVSQQLSSPDK